MTFTEERLMADRALEAKDSDTEYPPAAERVRKARLRLGISESEVATRWGFQPSLYWDLELHDSEVFDCVDLDELPRLARVLETPVLTLLLGSEPPEPPVPVAYVEVARRIGAEAARRNISVDRLAEAVGWELMPIVQDPDSVGRLNLHGLYDICKAIGLDWVSVLAEADSRSRRTSA